jgi:SAM-dependent methyltransferase
MDIELPQLFAEPLEDLGDANPDFRGILAPLSERGAPKAGVTAQFLEHAADYHAAYANVEYFRLLIDVSLARLAAPLAPGAILDIGSGSGNSVIPLLDRFPDAFVVAVDISPWLLAILRDHLEREGTHRGRYALVCMDASRDCYRPGAFDLAVGAAILHHIIEPRRVLQACASALAPGGAAIFFEPFEAGHDLLLLAYRAILAEAQRREETGAGMDMLRRLVTDYEVRKSNVDDAVLRGLDDKWLFTRSFFRDAGRGEWAQCDIHPINGEVSPLTEQTRVNLQLGLGREKNALPGWVWQRLAEFETTFSAGAREDLLFEGAVVMRKRGSSGERLRRVLENEPESGWWWSPGESGTGYFLAAQGTRLAVFVCGYGQDGAPLWYRAGPARIESGTWGAACRRMGERAGTADDAPMRMALEFESTRSARLRLDDFERRIEPQYQAELRQATGCWLEDAAEPRLALLAQWLPDSVFAALLAPDGWCVTVAKRLAERMHEGDWLRFSDGQAVGGAYRKPRGPEALAHSRIVWTDDDCLLVLLPGGRRHVFAREQPWQPS